MPTTICPNCGADSSLGMPFSCTPEVVRLGEIRHEEGPMGVIPTADATAEWRLTCQSCGWNALGKFQDETGMLCLDPKSERVPYPLKRSNKVPNELKKMERTVNLLAVTALILVTGSAFSSVMSLIDHFGNWTSTAWDLLVMAVDAYLSAKIISHWQKRRSSESHANPRSR